VAAVRAYNWTQIGGSALALDTIPTTDTVLRLPAVVVPGVYEFRLSVVSECAIGASDTLTVQYMALAKAGGTTGSVLTPSSPQQRSGTESPVQTFGQSAAVLIASPLATNTASDAATEAAQPSASLADGASTARNSAGSAVTASPHLRVLLAVAASAAVWLTTLVHH
jgi:hypothetical protein